MTRPRSSFSVDEVEFLQVAMVLSKREGLKLLRAICRLAVEGMAKPKFSFVSKHIHGGSFGVFEAESGVV